MKEQLMPCKTEFLWFTHRNPIASYPLIKFLFSLSLSLFSAGILHWCSQFDAESIPGQDKGKLARKFIAQNWVVTAIVLEQPTKPTIRPSVLPSHAETDSLERVSYFWPPRLHLLLAIQSGSKEKLGEPELARERLKMPSQYLWGVMRRLKLATKKRRERKIKKDDWTVRDPCMERRLVLQKRKKKKRRELEACMHGASEPECVVRKKRLYIIASPTPSSAWEEV